MNDTVVTSAVLLLMSCVLTDDKWGDVPTYRGRGRCEHALPSISSTGEANGYWPRGIWPVARLKHVRHLVAA